jgi:hypothetical protein
MLRRIEKVAGRLEPSASDPSFCMWPRIDPPSSCVVGDAIIVARQIRTEAANRVVRTSPEAKWRENSAVDRSSGHRFFGHHFRQRISPEAK